MVIFRRYRPGLWGYVAAAVVLIVGLTLSSWFMLTSLSGRVVAMQRVIVPGTAELTLSEPGTYTIYYESQSTVNGQMFVGSETVPGLMVVLTHNSLPVPVSQGIGVNTYTVSGYRGVSVLEFNAKTAGTYQITAEYGNGVSGSRVVLAIGQFNVMPVVLRFMTMIFSSLLAAWVVVRVAHHRRQRAA